MAQDPFFLKGELFPQSLHDNDLFADVTWGLPHRGQTTAL